jgi:wobble nucleotide-excising tRNase
MLRKIIKIRNVGRFDNCSWRGGTQFEEMALIYGENSRGKSTFCDVLRSLQTGLPDTILGRKRLGTADAPEIELRTDGGNLLFGAGVWSSILPDIAVFDTSYVHHNIFAGDRIDHDHKKNLYRLIVGETGLKLADKVDQLDADARAATRTIDDKRVMLLNLYPRGTDLAAVGKIKVDSEIALKVSAKETEIRNAEVSAARSVEINTKPALVTISINTVPNEFASLLNKKLSNMGDEAQIVLKKHLAEHTKDATEDWVSQGVEFSNDNECPFCGQSTENLDLITAYRSFFDRAYKDFGEQLFAVECTHNQHYGHQAVIDLNKAITDNAARWDFWKPFALTNNLELPDMSNSADILDELEAAAAELFRQKYRSIAESVTLSQRYTDAVRALESLRATSEAYNAVVLAINERVVKFRAQHASTDLAALRIQLGELKLVEKKQSAEAVEATKAYTDAIGAKAQLETDKTKAKSELDAYSADVLKMHDKRINELLVMFGAGFSIGSTERSYVGGKPSSNYSLLINRVPVELGDDRTPIKTPSFKNTLSAGDRSTLALAFFISQLERDPKLADKIVVFDDPFTSQDRSRRSATLSLIGSLSEKAKQVFILSHDPFFLRACWDTYKGGNVTSCHQFFRLGEATTTGEWDIERETLPEYSKKHKIIWDYCYSSTGSPLEVAQTIRPVLEEYLRLKLPRCFQDNEWLGQFIEKIRNSPVGEPLAAAQVILPRIEYINEYGKRFHHSSTRAADTAVMDQTELCTYAKATLDLVGGF